MAQLLVGLLVFLGVHSVSIVAPAARDRWAANMGANAWRGLYSFVSFAGFVLLVHGFGVARQAPVVLYVAPAWMHAVTMLLMLPVFPLWLASQVPGKINAVVRHPMLTAIMIWSFTHLLANGTLADVVLFGGFFSWSVLDRLSFLHRVERPRKMAPPGPWNDALVIAAGLLIYACVLLWLHAWIVGVRLR